MKLNRLPPTVIYTFVAAVLIDCEDDPGCVLEVVNEAITVEACNNGLVEFFHGVSQALSQLAPKKGARMSAQRDSDLKRNLEERGVGDKPAQHMLHDT